mgnify:CR=1 FL=1
MFFTKYIFSVKAILLWHTLLFLFRKSGKLCRFDDFDKNYTVFLFFFEKLDFLEFFIEQTLENALSWSFFNEKTLENALSWHFLMKTHPKRTPTTTTRQQDKTRQTSVHQQPPCRHRGQGGHLIRSYPHSD